MMLVIINTSSSYTGKNQVASNKEETYFIGQLKHEMSLNGEPEALFEDAAIIHSDTSRGSRAC